MKTIDITSVQDKKEIYMILVQEFNQELDGTFYHPELDEPIEFIVHTKNGDIIAKAHWSDELEEVAIKVLTRNMVRA